MAALLIPALMRSDGAVAQTPDDRATLEALYDATGGSGWTTSTNWKAAPTLVHTFKLTAGTSAAGSVGYNASGFTSFGSVRDSSGSVTLNGRTYTLRELFQSSPSASSNPNEIKLQVKVSSGSAMPADFADHHLRIGTTTLAIADAIAQTLGAGRQNFAWLAQTAGLITSGNVDIQLLRTVALSSWHGVTTNSMGRVTALALASNGLRGTAPATLGQLTALTSLDLSGNANLSGNIPGAWTALTALTALDLSGTGVCADPDDDAVNAWLEGIRTGGGSATVDVCETAPPPSRSAPAPTRPAPVIVIPYATITLAVAEDGPAPDDAAYALRLDCGNAWFTPTLAAGETYEAAAIAGSTCSLSVTDAAGAAEVRGEFAERTFDAGRYAATVTLVHAEPEPSPTERLDAALTAGETSVRWHGAETPVAEVVGGLTRCVTAVHHWDADAGAWRSWFPNADALGVNTLAAFQPDADYFVFAAEPDDGGADQACERASGSSAVTPSS